MANLSTKQIVSGQRLPLGRPNCIQANQRRRGLLYQHDAVEGESCHVVSGPLKASAECDPLAEKVVEHQTDGPRRLCYSLFFFLMIFCAFPLVQLTVAGVSCFSCCLMIDLLVWLSIRSCSLSLFVAATPRCWQGIDF